MIQRTSELPWGPTSLLERAQAGDGQAFGELAGPFRGRLLGLARRVVRNHADAEEVVQEALLKAFAHLGQYRAEAAFSTWLVRITLNEACMFLRRQRPETTPLDDLHPERWHLSGLWPAPDLDPEQICATRQIEALVRCCLDRIRPNYRIVLSLKALDDKTHEEIAKELEIPVQTVRVRLHRARRELRRMLAAWAGPAAKGR